VPTGCFYVFMVEYRHRRQWKQTELKGRMGFTVFNSTSRGLGGQILSCLGQGQAKREWGRILFIKNTFSTS
jgi:hypothetical protein